MNVWTRWLRQPQNVLLRRILFQIHLWVGLGLGLYVLMISVTGSLLVYRRDLAVALTTKPVTPAEHRLTADQFKAIVQRAYPGFDLQEVYTPSVRGRIVPDQAVQVQLRRGDQTIARFFDPYTGADLGAMKQSLINFILWLADLHDDLLGGDTGRRINGLGAILATILALTGIILWWPGIRNWRHSLTIDWTRKRYGFNWSLHNAVGFWMFFFVLLWGISGIYLCFPKPFNATVDFFRRRPPKPRRRHHSLLAGSTALRAIFRTGGEGPMDHFGTGPLCPGNYGRPDVVAPHSQKTAVPDCSS